MAHRRTLIVEDRGVISQGPIIFRSSTVSLCGTGLVRSDLSMIPIARINSFYHHTKDGCLSDFESCYRYRQTQTARHQRAYLKPHE